MSEEATPVDAGSQGATATSAPVSFLDSLPEDLRAEPSLRNFTDHASLAKSYVHAQRMIGAEKIPLPGKSASDDEWRAVFQRLGAPTDPSKYELSANALQKEHIEALRKRGVEAGLTNKQLQAVASLYDETVAAGQQQFREQSEQARFDAERALRQEFGLAFEQKLDRAQKAAINLLGGTEIFDEIQLADGRMLGDHPEIVKMFARLADSIAEDQLEGATTETIMTPAEASAQINVLMREPAYMDKYHPAHDKIVAEVARLWEYKTPSAG